MKIQAKILENVNKNNAKRSNIHNLNPDNALENEIQKNVLIPCSTLDGLFNDTTHNSLRWIYRSVKIVWTKKTCWVYPVEQLSRTEFFIRV